MKYPKIDLKNLRLKSKQFHQEQPRLLLVFLLPSLLLIATRFLSPLTPINEDILETSFVHFLTSLIQNSLFPLTLGFLCSIILTGALFTSLNILHQPRTEVSFMSSLSLLDDRRFTPTFLTLLLKRFYLFLWGIPSLLGIICFFYSSLIARRFVALHPEFPTIDLSNVDTERFLLTFALYFFGSLILMIVGWLLYIPQYYAYSQVEPLLCDTVAIGLAKPSRILKTSRFLMKGYKFQRFVLDLQLLPWYILIWISFGIAGISIYPYIYSCQLFFYQRLLEIKRRKV